MLEFSPNTEMSQVKVLADELFEHVLHDEEPIFVSDEATLWDVSMSDVDEVLGRVRKYYGVSLSLEETQQFPLWNLLRLLDERRRAANGHPS